MEEDFRLTAQRVAAQQVSNWIRDWGVRDAELIVARMLTGVYGELGPEFRDAYLAAWGR